MEHVKTLSPKYLIIPASILILIVIAFFILAPSKATEIKSLSCPDNNHPHLIDLGLPSGTLWACCNVGAGKPEELGGYYAWGETEEKDEYDSKNYKFYDIKAHEEGKKYHECFHSLGDDIAGTQFDVATKQWGDQYKMPSRNQFQELIDTCKFEWTILNDVKGAKFTGPSGKCIFFPAAGFKKDDTFLAKSNSLYWAYGLYWSSTQTPKPDSASYAYRFYFNSNEPHLQSYHRYYGRTIRPVNH